MLGNDTADTSYTLDPDLPSFDGNFFSGENANEGIIRELTCQMLRESMQLPSHQACIILLGDIMQHA